MGTKGRLRRLQRAMRGKLDFIELADGSRHYFDPEEAVKDNFLFLTGCMRAEYKREPRPEPPELLRAVSNARDRGEALSRVMGGYNHLPLDEGLLVERGELVPRSLVAGRDVNEPVRDLSE